ncbi:phosphatase PAP2 family protein [Spongiibacter sp.]|uniref:phosphatase PAP2 family protein n=1 Tax=Spongiibacter sp. TaxID=2024860 RepID=UPI003567BF32
MRVIQAINQFDVRMFLACVNSRHQHQLCKLAFGISKSGDGYTQLLLPLLLSAWGVTGSGTFLSSVATGFGIWLPLYWLLKNSCRRRRPPAAIPQFNAAIIASDEFSFPSGHTAAAFLLATLAVLCFGAIASPLFLWAVAVAASRVILGVHFPTDTVAGAGLGIAIAHLAYNLLSS